ncbi:Autotransporter domain outer membrane protein [Phytophthora palmivora]|uniref:Autotransporter domain outer membrane protein n=1 Tax=Phytophthora palmivora TaxID=4796 RepID=A0A2P4XL30_9STRA|nr:Autotransporter domain outer membrane protein [Phytophthora palmivora]
MASVRTLLLSLQLVSLVSISTQHCSQLRIPPANVEYVMLHIDSFNSVEDTGNFVCESFGVPKYRCNNVKKEVLETLTEMAQLAIRESVVNVSLDRSLAYDIWKFDDVTQEKVKVSEPIVVYPEQPLLDTVAEYCKRFKLDNQSCENVAGSIGDLVERDWGCDDPDTSTDEGKEFVEIPLLLDQQEHQIKVDTSSDGTRKSV